MYLRIAKLLQQRWRWVVFVQTLISGESENPVVKKKTTNREEAYNAPRTLGITSSLQKHVDAKGFAKPFANPFSLIHSLSIRGLDVHDLFFTDTEPQIKKTAFGSNCDKTGRKNSRLQNLIISTKP
ncbi:MAG: hypothetical protein D8M57_11540 [Candidatus Scalindua sp. AMX11]|nr:MAG: hypothetical protein DWQ00_17850 [Candidatus Scalindua sp.]TDE64730.1 MAG: hypothetical protein D8M57_11540 [Candidatus Scalindua sp. AMX11]